MKTTLTGKRLLAKLAECPNDAYPQGISEDADGNIVLDDSLLISSVAQYTITDDVRDRDVVPVNTVDSDLSISLSLSRSRCPFLLD